MLLSRASRRLWAVLTAVTSLFCSIHINHTTELSHQTNVLAIAYRGLVDALQGFNTPGKMTERTSRVPDHKKTNCPSAGCPNKKTP